MRIDRFSSTLRSCVVAAACLGATAVVAAAAGPDAPTQSVLDALKGLGVRPIHTLTPKEARTNNPSPADAVQAVVQKKGQKPLPIPVDKVEDRRIPGPVKPIALRVYTPKGKGPHPAVVFFHGGGFVIADLDVYDASARGLQKASDAVVVSAHYRQAPEHPFPASHDDAVAAYRWVIEHAAELDVDAARVAVAGESAGANLATVVSMRSKSEGFAPPVAQLLIYPFVDTDLSKPSNVQNGKGDFIIANEDLAWFWQHELGANWKTTSNPLAVPARATTEQLKGLPPAHVVVAGLDPLLDQGVAYAEQLKAAGVVVDLRRYDGVTHEFFGMVPVVPKAAEAQKAAGTALKTAFAAQKKK